MKAIRSVAAMPTGIVLVLGLALTACSTTQTATTDNEPSNAGQVLSTTETAPADLQLTCSNAAATQFGLPLDKVLPVASSKQPDGNYVVKLTSGGQNFVCLVDDNASILNISPT